MFEENIELSRLYLCLFIYIYMYKMVKVKKEEILYLELFDQYWELMWEGWDQYWRWDQGGRGGVSMGGMGIDWEEWGYRMKGVGGRSGRDKMM